MITTPTVSGGPGQAPLYLNRVCWCLMARPPLMVLVDFSFTVGASQGCGRWEEVWCHPWPVLGPVDL